MRLVFDIAGRRWEGFILPIEKWTLLDEYNGLLTIAYGETGELAGFIFDLDTSDADAPAAFARLRELFGDSVANRVANPDDTAGGGTMVPLTTSAIVETVDNPVFPVLAGINARARDVVISEDPAKGVIRVSMRLPWWAAWLRPWVTIRRRGRPEVIALGPLRRVKGAHIAELHYGLPTPTSSLVAEVIKGGRNIWMSAILSSVVTAIILAIGFVMSGVGDSRSDTATPLVTQTTLRLPTTTVLPITSTTATPSTSVESSTTIETTTTAPAVTTTNAPRRSTTTSSTVLPPGGVSFTLPSQYQTANDTRADVAVDRVRIRRGETLNVSVRISGVFINPFDSPGITSLVELVAACRSLINVGVVVPPTPGWTPNISVTLVGTGVTAGGSTQLIVIGNIATECGDSLIGTNPSRINVVRTTFYREVPITLEIPATLTPGRYQLVLDNLNLIMFTKTTPIDITVTE
jgi:hypothetical protein